MTSLKKGQLDIERALKHKTDQLVEVEFGVRQIATTLQQSPAHASEPAATSALRLKAPCRSAS